MRHVFAVASGDYIPVFRRKVPLSNEQNSPKTHSLAASRFNSAIIWSN